MTASHTIRPESGVAFEAPSGEKLRIVHLPNAEGLSAHRVAWAELAAAACEGNVFYEPWLLEPAIEALADGVRLEIVLIYEDGAGRAGRLCGLFPLERRPAEARRPLPTLGLWKHVHCFLCTPLVRAESGTAVLEAFFHWLAHGDVSASWMAFDHIAADGPFAGLLASVIAQHGAPSLEDQRFERALVRTTEDADTYLRASLSGKRRREVERHQRRLAADADLRFRMLEPGDGDALPDWLEAFLALEASGWKGRGGTAIASRPAERRFFLEAARRAFEVDRLMLLALELDGRPVAMKCNFLTPRAHAGGFAFKIAFDEALSQHSPGLILEFENLRRIHEAPRLDWMDSCAKAEHPMLDRLWRQRRTIADVLVPTGRPGGALGLRALEALKRLKRSGAIWVSSARSAARRGPRGPDGDSSQPAAQTSRTDHNDEKTKQQAKKGQGAS